MPKYRNVKTGVTVTIQGEARGDWELVSEPLSSVKEEAKPGKPEAPEKPKKKASKPKKK